MMVSFELVGIWNIRNLQTKAGPPYVTLTLLHVCFVSSIHEKNTPFCKIFYIILLYTILCLAIEKNNICQRSSDIFQYLL